ncbi:hypothetical protein DBQ68_10605 [Lactobacillus sp. DS15_6]|nr:hypothetical protein [Lacticaseibacillus paracasei]PTS49655.1 hypothetical protein DBQ62_09870 [Lactobacillus sp. DS9_6]PTS60901.1 hypothetical protein DBQ68_10605 [Lactobacillus sp. DS15_6]PTS70083.1 hypothetical protein DBQ65_08585 [Lactobacillus sp. DS3_6]PTV39604.1 hypothetical protein DB343_10710 [Lactobacillus sp. DS18_6]
MPRRSDRRPDGARPCKQHSDWARSAVSALASRRKPHLAGDCGVWHGKRNVSLALCVQRDRFPHLGCQ